MLDQREGTIADSLGTAQLRGKQTKAADLSLREFGDDPQLSETLKLALEIVDKIAEEVLGVIARLLGKYPVLLRRTLGAARTLGVHVRVAGG